MRAGLDFSSWNTLASTLVGLLLVSFLAVGVRLLFMQTIQRRRERENRQINERLRTLIAAYKTLGGSFTGQLLVDPGHLREQRAAASGPQALEAPPPDTVAERRRRTRDAVESALSDIILLGTETQVRLAARAARDMVAGQRVDLAELVVALREHIRHTLDLEPVPAGLDIPPQGPVRTAGGSGRGAGARGEGGGRGGGGGGGGGMGAGVGMGLGGGAVLGRSGRDGDIGAGGGAT